MGKNHNQTTNSLRMASQADVGDITTFLSIGGMLALASCSAPGEESFAGRADAIENGSILIDNNVNLVRVDRPVPETTKEDLCSAAVVEGFGQQRF